MPLFSLFVLVFDKLFNINVTKAKYVSRFVRDFSNLFQIAAAMAEWLRRWTRNPMGSPRAGSNPARSDTFKKFKRNFAVCLNFSSLETYVVHKRRHLNYKTL